MSPPHVAGSHSAPEAASVSAAQTCVDEARVQEHAVSAGLQEPPYRLNCPLEPAPSSGSPPYQTAWQKDCRQLPAQDGRRFLEFASVSPEDQGNYTCVHQGNSTASYTLRLIVEGTYKCTGPALYVVRGQTCTKGFKAWPDAGPEGLVACSQRR